ncbi:MAG: MATE family efflux transporter [Muribaculaceae bacterium]|nr:MATE family efflux transporter [Muribaculaceae bacterium]
MNREILHIALPAIVANITIPLLGLLDTAIAGHLGSATFIGAIAVGSMIFNLVYWNFGFLRMSTSGLTAQTYGLGDRVASERVLREACLVAMAVALGIIVLQVPLLKLALWVIDPSTEVRQLAVTYYYIVVWGAPPVLLMMAIKGWLLGIQDSRGAMWVSIVVNVLNIVASLTAVYGLHMGFKGIAVGTLVAEWLGLGFAVLLLQHSRKTPFPTQPDQARSELATGGFRRFFKVSGDIFLRSFLLMLVNLAVVAIGARSGDLILAVNALIQQLNTLFAYFMDGIAFAGEALVGKYYGRGDDGRMRLCVRRLFVWAVCLTAVFTLLYAFPQYIFALLTDAAEVITASMDYRWWCTLLPVAGMAAFVWDGVFIGLTRSRAMLVAVAVASVTFAALYAALPATMGNHRLWLAFVVYLAMRGVVQTVSYFRKFG